MRFKWKFSLTGVKNPDGNVLEYDKFEDGSIRLYKTRKKIEVNLIDEDGTGEAGFYMMN